MWQLKGMTGDGSQDPIVLDGAGVDAPLRRAERKRLDLAGKLYLAPLTTVGNLPFRCRAMACRIASHRLAPLLDMTQSIDPGPYALS